MTSFYVALGAVVGLGVVGFLAVWFGAPLVKAKSQVNPQIELPELTQPMPRPTTQSTTRRGLVSAGR
jgi:hypothetical protein